MVFRVLCPTCKTPLNIPDHLLGKTARCTNCNGTFKTAPPQAPAPRRAEQALMPAPASAVQPARPARRDTAPAGPGVARPEVPAKARSSSGVGLLIAALVAVPVLLLVLGGVGAAGVYFLWLRGHSQAARHTPEPAGDHQSEVAVSDKKPPPEPPPDKPDPRPPTDQRPPEPPPIEVAPLTADKETRSLPGAVDDLCAGGNGRYLILHIPSKRQLAVFDCLQLKVVKYLPVAEDKVKFAAGRDKLFVILPTANVIQRYSLATLEKETSQPAPVKGPVTTTLMGSASSGPLFLAYGADPLRGAETALLDAKTLKPLAAQIKPQGFAGFGDGFISRVSADGRLFTTYMPQSSPQGQAFFVLSGDSAKQYDIAIERMLSGHVTPSPNSRYVFTTQGQFTAEGSPITKRGEAGKSYALPAADDETFYLNIDVAGWPHGNEIQRGPQKSKLFLHLADDDRPVAPLDQVELPPGINGWDREGPISTDQRLHFLPAAKLLVVLPKTNDRLDLYRVDPEALLAKSDRDYLYVASRPPAEVAKGSTYVYPVDVKSKKDGVKVRLESEPPGMKVADAKLNWDVPADFADADVDVILNVTDAGGKEVFQSFRISLTDKK
jgi:hypothetical protein